MINDHFSKLNATQRHEIVGILLKTMPSYHGVKHQHLTSENCVVCEFFKALKEYISNEVKHITGT